jgi:UDP-N-acetylmuramoyl-tripeptide--D-alanyl-D-alanine ligase
MEIVRYPIAIDLRPILIGLTVLANLSPLLTFARLWQLKEWRWDRLRDHLEKENWLRQLFGRIRPAIIAIAGLLFAFDLQNETHVLPLDQWILSVIVLLALISVGQIIMRRQPRPVWTKKAILLVGTALLLSSAVAALPLWIETSPWYLLILPLLPLLQPFFLAIARAIFWPLDQFLKGNILRKARHLRAQFPKMTVVGVTGSVGKTTTKELLHHVLGDFKPLTTPAHVNSEIGVAQWLIRSLKTVTTETAPKLLIVEMGAYRRGEIALLASIVKQTIGVLTYIGDQHVALFGSREALTAAKAEILTTLPKTGHAFINGDNEVCARLRDIAPCPSTLVGTGAGVELKATDIEETPQGICFMAGQTTFDVPLHGTHNVTNVLLAIAVGQHMGMSLPAIATKLQTFQPPKQTFEVRHEQDVRLLDDTHNASVASFTAAIEWAKNQPMAEKVLLTAGIIELGEQEERAHMELGAQCASVFHRVIFTQERSADAFSRGFGRPVELLGKDAVRPVQKDSLLVCIGRMGQGTIRRFLPSS